jgi:hypothetical protein
MILAWDGVVQDFQEILLVSDGWTSATDVSGWGLGRIMWVARILCLTGNEEQYDGSVDFSKPLNPRNEAAAIGILWDSLQQKDPGRHVLNMHWHVYCTILTNKKSSGAIVEPNSVDHRRSVYPCSPDNLVRLNIPPEQSLPCVCSSHLITMPKHFTVSKPNVADSLMSFKSSDVS